MRIKRTAFSAWVPKFSAPQVSFGGLLVPLVNSRVDRFTSRFRCDLLFNPRNLTLDHQCSCLLLPCWRSSAYHPLVDYPQIHNLFCALYQLPCTSFRNRPYSTCYCPQFCSLGSSGIYFPVHYSPPSLRLVGEIQLCPLRWIGLWGRHCHYRHFLLPAVPAKWRNRGKQHPKVVGKHIFC